MPPNLPLFGPALWGEVDGLAYAASIAEPLAGPVSNSFREVDVLSDLRLPPLVEVVYRLTRSGVGADDDSTLR